MTEKKATGWSREKVVEELRGLFMQLGRTPAERDASTSLTQAAIAHFGSWNEAKRAAGLETCSRGPKRTNLFTYLRAIAEGLRRLNEAIEEMTKLRKDEIQTDVDFAHPDSARPSPLHDISCKASSRLLPLCRDLNWLKIRLGLLMIHLPELAEREGFALGTKPPQTNRVGHQFKRE